MRFLLGLVVGFQFTACIGQAILNHDRKMQMGEYRGCVCAPRE